MSRRRVFVTLGSAVCLASLTISQLAAAEVSSAQRATAEALFQQAAQLMGEKHFNEACEKFAASQELDPGLGTMLYLADCYEQAGRTASAWALFREAADASRRAEQHDREHIASERALSLEARLTKLELRVAPAQRVPGLELRINNAPVPSASWNVPLPVDPGPTHIEARASGKQPWLTQVTLANGPVEHVIEIRQLANAPQPLKTERAPATDGKLSPPAPGETQRLVGYVVGAVGLVALGAGGFFGYRAYTLNQRSKENCRADAPNDCTPTGVSTREDAQLASTLSTVTTLSGGVLLATGVTLVLTAPSGAPARAFVSDPSRASAGAFGLQLRGVW